MPLYPSLPSYLGRHAVGICDIEWKYDPDRLPALARLYYPSSPSGQEPRPFWLPSYHYGQGYGDFARIPRWVSVPLFKALTSFTKIPGYWNAPVSTEHKWPIIYFSHGLGGNRTTYSTICGELASHGFVVCAMEHRDRSASVSRVYETDELVSYQRPPASQGKAEFDFRRSQVLTRATEVKEAVKFFENLNAGRKVNNTAEGHESNVIEGFAGRLDLSKQIISGHSFGSATALCLLQQQHTSPRPDYPFKLGIVLDAWMLAVNATEPISTPLLSVNTASFHWRENADALSRVLSSARAHAHSLHIVLKDTAHQNQSDFPVLFPFFRKLKTGMAGMAEPVAAIQLNNTICLEWIRRNLDVEDLGVPVNDNVLSEDETKRPQEMIMSI
ncbi:platelet-activating factor acetylhydrolase [Gaertneriomyces semiglobifer]|nr:platelet-activating factor acetylhydrolase [Gaertneriomyces semiglobifer]